MLYLIVVFTILLDQVSKFAAVKYLKGNEPYIIINDVFRLYYIENSGAAFGILQNRKSLFIIITSIVVVSIIFFLVKYPNDVNKLMKISMVLLVGGAIGNLIDRIRLGYVIDFLSVKLPWGYNFPVFNFADIFVVLGTISIMIMVLFNRYEN